MLPPGIYTIQWLAQLVPICATRYIHNIMGSTDCEASCVRRTGNRSQTYRIGIDVAQIYSRVSSASHTACAKLCYPQHIYANTVGSTDCGSKLCPKDRKHESNVSNWHWCDISSAPVSSASHTACTKLCYPVYTRTRWVAQLAAASCVRRTGNRSQTYRTGIDTVQVYSRFPLLRTQLVPNCATRHIREHNG